MKVEKGKITYYISHMDEETKKKNVELYLTIEKNGDYIDSRWAGDYLVATYKYNGKTYELWDNMEYGIMSEIVEYKENTNEQQD